MIPSATAKEQLLDKERLVDCLQKIVDRVLVNELLSANKDGGKQGLMKQVGEGMGSLPQPTLTAKDVIELCDVIQGILTHGKKRTLASDIVQLFKPKLSPGIASRAEDLDFWPVVEGASSVHPQYALFLKKVAMLSPDKSQRGLLWIKQSLSQRVLATHLMFVGRKSVPSFLPRHYHPWALMRDIEFLELVLSTIAKLERPVDKTIDVNTVIRTHVITDTKVDRKLSTCFPGPAASVRLNSNANTTAPIVNPEASTPKDATNSNTRSIAGTPQTIPDAQISLISSTSPLCMSTGISSATSLASDCGEQVPVIENCQSVGDKFRLASNDNTHFESILVNTNNPVIPLHIDTVHKNVDMAMSVVQEACISAFPILPKLTNEDRSQHTPSISSHNSPQTLTPVESFSESWSLPYSLSAQTMQTNETALTSTSTPATRVTTSDKCERDESSFCEGKVHAAKTNSSVTVGLMNNADVNTNANIDMHMYTNMDENLHENVLERTHNDSEPLNELEAVISTDLVGWGKESRLLRPKYKKTNVKRKSGRVVLDLQAPIDTDLVSSKDLSTIGDSTSVRRYKKLGEYYKACEKGDVSISAPCTMPPSPSAKTETHTSPFTSMQVNAQNHMSMGATAQDYSTESMFKSTHARREAETEISVSLVSSLVSVSDPAILTSHETIRTRVVTSPPSHLQADTPNDIGIGREGLTTSFHLSRTTMKDTVDSASKRIGTRPETDKRKDSFTAKSQSSQNIVIQNASDMDVLVDSEPIVPVDACAGEEINVNSNVSPTPTHTHIHMHDADTSSSFSENASTGHSKETLNTTANVVPRSQANRRESVLDQGACLDSINSINSLGHSADNRSTTTARHTIQVEILNCEKEIEDEPGQVSNTPEPPTALAELTMATSIPPLLISQSTMPEFSSIRKTSTENSKTSPPQPLQQLHHQASSLAPNDGNQKYGEMGAYHSDETETLNTLMEFSQLTPDIQSMGQLGLDQVIQIEKQRRAYKERKLQEELQQAVDSTQQILHKQTVNPDVQPKQLDIGECDTSNLHLHTINQLQIQTQAQTQTQARLQRLGSQTSGHRLSHAFMSQSTAHTPRPRYGAKSTDNTLDSTSVVHIPRLDREPPEQAIMLDKEAGERAIQMAMEDKLLEDDCVNGWVRRYEDGASESADSDIVESSGTSDDTCLVGSETELAVSNKVNANCSADHKEMEILPSCSTNNNNSSNGEDGCIEVKIDAGEDAEFRRACTDTSPQEFSMDEYNAPSSESPSAVDSVCVANNADVNALVAGLCSFPVALNGIPSTFTQRRTRTNKRPSPVEDVSIETPNRRIQPENAPNLDLEIVSSAPLVYFRPPRWRTPPDYVCSGCGRMRVTFKYGFRFCNHDGRFHCRSCHHNIAVLIPARVVKQWDFTPRAVCDTSKVLLSNTRSDPIYNLRFVSPELYKTVPELVAVEKLRVKLGHLFHYVRLCRVGEPFMSRVQHTYLADNPTIYSMVDMYDVYSGQMRAYLRKLVSIFREHVLECELCIARAYVCEMCNDRSHIFPFDTEDTYQCDICSGLYHAQCFKKSFRCPRCERRDKRRQHIPRG
eukprot:CFRG3077T1